MENVLVKNIRDLSFVKEVKRRGGNIFQVGGFVRDQFLGKESKDLDILIQGLSYEDLENILQKYGKVDLVGKSFGVIKFKPFGHKEDIDIAIPRIDKKLGVGHKGFETYTGKNISINDDLGRRDITINAIAKSIDGKIYDPFGGINDIKDKVIRAVSKNSFIDDPLRMLRAIIFASRFNFKIEPKTEELIKKNAHLIKEISPERILIEFEKIVTKGNIPYGVELLVDLKLFEQIFGFSFIGNIKIFNQVKDMADFIFLCFENQKEKPSLAYKNKFKGTTENEKQIESLEMLKDITDDKFKNRFIVAKMLSKSPTIRKSGLLNNNVLSIISDFDSGKYPKNINELEINGNELMDLGFKGKDIGAMNVKIFAAILGDKLKNNKKDIIDFIQKKTEEEILQESFKKEKITKLAIFDFDKTLVKTEEPETGKKIWKEKTGNEFPHIGWWSKSESLDSNIFKNETIKETLDGHNRVKNEPGVYKVLITGRIKELSDVVKNILDKKGFKFDDYIFADGGKTIDFKIKKLNELMKIFPKLETIEMWEDRKDHIPIFKSWAERQNINFILHEIKS